MDTTNPNDAKERFRRIHDAICSNDISVIKTIKSIASPIAPEETIDKISSLESDFQLTLDFLKSGAQDPKRGLILQHLRRRLHTLADEVELRLYGENGTNAHANKCAASFSSKADIESLVAQYKQSALTSPASIDALDDLCDALDVHYFAATDINSLNEFIFNDVNTPDIDKEYVISVLGHNILHIFQPSVALLILQAVRNNVLGNKALPRAAAVIATSILSHANRWDDDDELASAIKQVATDRPDFANLVRTAFTMTTKELLTAEVVKFIAKDILDEVKSMAKSLSDFKDPESELFKNINADKKSFADKFTYLNDLAIDGIDINFASQEALRSLPFFLHTTNWIRPFDARSRKVAEQLNSLQPETIAQLGDALSHSTFCDSDRYGMMLLASNVPPGNIQSMCSAIFADGELKANAQREHYNLAKTDFLAAMETENFIKDLYRVAVINPVRHGVLSLFDESQWNVKSNAFRAFFASDTSYDDFGSTLVKYKCYKPAASIFQQLFALTKDANHARKLAFCQYELQQYDEAIKSLSTADVIDNSDSWTKRTLAKWFFEKGNHALALKFCLEAEALKPLKADVLAIKAFCQLSVGRTSDALNSFLGLTFNSPEIPDGYVGAAFALFRLRRIDEVAKYVQMAKELDAPSSPFLPDVNIVAGLAALARMDVPAALDSFRQSNGAEAAKHLCAEVDTLLSYGIPKNDFLLFLRLI